MNGFAFGCAIAYLCIRQAALGNLKASFHCAHLHCLCTRLQQTLSETQQTKRIIINFKNFQGNETKSQSHQVRRTTAKQIGYVSVSYRFRIDLVSIPYRSRIVLLSFSLPEAETIRKRYGNNRRSKGETRENAPNSKHFQIFKTLQLWQDSMVS